MNIVYDREMQKCIEKYIYCKEFGVPAYPGSYADQPKRWVDMSFAIKKALAKKEQSIIDKQNKEVKNG